MDKSKSFISIFIPSITVFISSFCIMVMELVASRLVARYLGSSLYTWTSVIGVILSGITIGNYVGGRIADKFPARKTIAVIFAACSAACVITIILNNLIGKWVWPWRMWNYNWPLYVLVHVSLIFLIPSALLGMISPVVAKMALDRGLPTGRTIGDIYAWGAAGSIAGTFAAGYYLIATMGTIAIIWTIGAVLLLMSIIYWRGSRLLYVWAVIFIAMVTMAMKPVDWANGTGAYIGLRDRPDSRFIYRNESQYSYISVWQTPDNPNQRMLYLDKLGHSVIMMNNIRDLQYLYEKIYAAVTEGLRGNKEKLCVMAIGGGGYVFPRYVEEVWPGSRIDVAEIDPAVTEAAMQAFGLKRNTTINIINMDARNYVDKLLLQKRNGDQIPQYDFIYGDAFNDFLVPFQLVTKEFNDKISTLLSDDGVYMINVMDIFDSGLFLGSVVSTLEETFPYVYVVTADASRSNRITFVIIAAKHKVDLKNILSQGNLRETKLWYLDASDISTLKQKSRHLILTDNYSPVETLLTPLACDYAKGLSSAVLLTFKRTEENPNKISAEKYIAKAEELQKKEQFKESIENYLLAIKMSPDVSESSYNEIAIMYANMGNLEQAEEAFNKAIQYNEMSGQKTNIASTRYNFGLFLTKIGKQEQAMEQFRKSTEDSQRNLTKNPTHEGWGELGDTLVAMGDLKGAAEAFKQAISLNPNEPKYYNRLIKILEYDGQYDQAIEVMKKFIELAKNYKQDEAVPQLQKHLELLEQKASAGQKN